MVVSHPANQEHPPLPPIGPQDHLPNLLHQVQEVHQNNLLHKDHKYLAVGNQQIKITGGTTTNLTTTTWMDWWEGLHVVLVRLGLSGSWATLFETSR